MSAERLVFITGASSGIGWALAQACLERGWSVALVARRAAALRAQLRPWMFAHVRERRIPVVLVTHDREDMADPQRVVTLTHAG